jgi:hypothetical protein
MPDPDDHDRFRELALSDRQTRDAYIRAQVDAAYQRGLTEGRSQAAAAVRAADTSAWPGGRQGDIDACQELAAGLAGEAKSRD